MAVRAVEGKMTGVYNDAEDGLVDLNRKYDNATDHGGDPTKQKWWNDTFFK